METRTEIPVGVGTRAVQKEYGNISRQAVAKKARNGRVRAIKISGRWIFDPMAVSAGAAERNLRRVLGQSA